MKKVIRIFLPILLLYFLPVSAFAAVYQINQLDTVIGNITDTLTWIVVSLLVLLIISFGIQFLLSADNPQERARLKSKAIWTLIGLFIILSARPLSLWLQSLLK